MKLENVGTIREFSLPDDWYEQTDKVGSVSGLRWERLFVPAARDGAELFVSYRGVPLDEGSRKVFTFMLKQGERGALPVEEILALHTVLGVATTGDNQYTNKNPADSIDGPTFNLLTARLVTVGGKVVLRVDGKFKNGRFYSGIYYPAGAEGRIVEELFLQTRNMDAYQKYNAQFETVLNSIAWR